jgi:RHH-type rel operon transcriptional repressor/antitoxin RelB
MKHEEEFVPMGDTTTLTIRIDQEIKDRLEAAAKSQKRSKAFLANEAIKEYLSVQEWQERRIRDALASADRGEGVSHESVMAWVRSWDADDELPTPRT